MSPTGNRLLVASLILGLLASGTALGVALDRLWLRPTASVSTQKEKAPRPRGEAREKLLLDKFQKQLDLDAAQTRKAGAEIHRMFSELDAIRARAFADLRRVRTERRAEIMKILTPAQQQKFREMIDAYEKRKAERLERRR